MTLIEEIVRRREDRGWSRMRLADESGISLETLRLIEEGHTEKPHRGTLSLLAQALRCSIEDLTGEAA